MSKSTQIQGREKRLFRGYANRHMIYLLAASIPSFIIAIFALSLANVSAYLIWFVGLIMALVIGFAAFSGKSDADYQLQTLANLIEAMIDGDYSLRGRKQDHVAFSSLLDLVNRLAETLQYQERKVQDHQILVEHVINQLDALIFVVSQTGQITLSNQAFNQQFSVKESTQNQSIQTIELTDTDRRALSESPKKSLINFSSHYLQGEYIVQRQTFINQDQPHQLFLLTQGESILSQKERQSWQNLLRILSHELNNSLAPIATFSRTMLKRLTKHKAAQTTPDFASFEQGAEIISERAESLHQFIAAYGQIAKLPPPQLQVFEWNPAIQRACALYPQQTFELGKIGDTELLPQTIKADPAQLQQVLINLIKNAVEANQSTFNRNDKSSSLTGITEDSPANTELLANRELLENNELLENTELLAHQENLEHREPLAQIDSQAIATNNQTTAKHNIIMIQISANTQFLSIAIIDLGPGIANPQNLFTPFYTTKPNGQGIGLTLSKQIIEQHSGKLSLTNRDDGSSGAIAQIQIPMGK
jgi:two-component system, NtrC family, nitrogen regulation sensor histidine kinase NtrY